MSVIYYCDGPGCVNKAAGEIGSEGWDSPNSWGGGRSDDKIYDTCSSACTEKVADMIRQAEEKEAAAKAEAEEQTITPDDVGTLEV
jgi:hypothetical protein